MGEKAFFAALCVNIVLNLLLPMYRLFFLLLLMAFAACHTAPVPRPADVKYDSVYIPLFAMDTVLVGDVPYPKEEFRKLSVQFRDLMQGFAFDPDEAYLRCVARYANDTGFVSWGSEVGQDAYCQVYAWLLKQKQDADSLKPVRENLLEIYQAINAIHHALASGGTYYMHMVPRIEAYVEYDLYLLRMRYVQAPAEPGATQKQLFIKSLYAEIKDGVRLNTDLTAEQRTELLGKVWPLVGDLDNRLHNRFYLSMARKFKYSRYR